MTDKIRRSRLSIKPSTTSSNKKSVEKEGRNRKRISVKEAKAKEANHLLRNVAITTPDLLFILNTREKHIKYLNSPSRDKSAEGKDFFNKIIEEDERKLWDELIDFKPLEPKSFGEIEVRIVENEKKIRHFRIRYTALNFELDEDLTDWFCQAREITESKEQLKQIEDSKLKLQMALEGSGMGIWSYDPASKKLECDDRTCSFFGLDQVTLNGDAKNILSRIHPDDRNYAISTAISTFQNRGRFNHDFRVLKPNSAVVTHVAVMGELFANEQAKVVKVTGVCLDISQNILWENKIKTNEAYLDELQRIAKIGCFDWDLMLDKVHLTRQMYSILGISAHETLSLTGFFEKIHPQDRLEAEEIFRNTLKTGTGFSKNFRYTPLGGETKVLWAQGKVRVDKNNRITRIIGTIQDISDKKENEKEFKTQNLIIRSILQNLPFIIQIIDRNGIIRQLLGEAGLKRIGKKENQAVGESIYDHSTEISKHIHRVFNGETVNFTEDIFYNGRQFHFLSYYFYDTEQEVAIGFSIDISAQKQTEAAYQMVSAKNKELQRVNQVMDMFVYAAAHDLKNPINNLEMLSMLLREAHSPTEQEEYQDALSKAVHRLKQTIHGLLEIIQIESASGFNGSIIKFQDVLDHVRADLDSQLKEKDGKLSIQLEQEFICYNEAFLTSILKNLLSNAIKYSNARKKPIIKIKTENKNGYVLLTVTDNGIGIDIPQVQSNLFKPFKRFTTQSEGTGVGLHLIKNMVEKNGGYIEIESTPGVGTSFFCYLVSFDDVKPLFGMT